MFTGIARAPRPAARAFETAPAGMHVLDKSRDFIRTASPMVFATELVCLKPGGSHG
ncbi:MAG: hypothetical protein P8Y78_09525 [Acidihalobacter sp.]|jgi:hypothetical protein